MSALILAFVLALFFGTAPVVTPSVPGSAQLEPPAGAPRIRPVSTPPSASYRGVNHLWIPALGISQPVYVWGCSPAALPARVESWTCSGRNDLYLLGHASSVFHPIYLYYERHGRLPAGLDLYEANSRGHVTHYRLAWTKRLAWDSAAEYAIAYGNLAEPSVTIQTCLNAAGTVDLIARFVIVR